ELFADAGEWHLKVLANIVRQRLQRRDIDDLRLVPETAGDSLVHQRVDRGEKGGERLARAGGRCDEHMLAGLDRRPSLFLRGGGRGEAPLEPGGDGGMEERGEFHGAGACAITGSPAE